MASILNLVYKKKKNAIDSEVISPLKNATSSSLGRTIMGISSSIGWYVSIDGKIQKRKGRPVVKKYSQKYDIHYHKTFKLRPKDNDIDEGYLYRELIAAETAKVAM